MSFESVMYTGCGRPSVRPASGQLECSRKKATANGILKITPGGRQRSLNLVHSCDKSVVCESLSVRGDNLKSGWSRGLRRYVQVVVHFVGVGSNPTSDKLFVRFPSPPHSPCVANFGCKTPRERGPLLLRDYYTQSVLVLILILRCGICSSLLLLLLLAPAAT